MKFLFTDESVSTENKFIVITGFYYDANYIKKIEEKLREECKKFGLISIEYVKNKEIDKQTREKFNNKVAEVIAEVGSRIISIVILSQENIESYLNGMRLLIERFFKELKNIDDIGLILYDEDYSKKNFIKKSLIDNGGFIKIGTKTYLTSLPNFISQQEIRNRVILFLFVDNKECFSIQVASIICGAVQKAINNLLKEKKALTPDNVEMLSEYFYGLKPYWNLFSRSPQGKIYGWGIKVWRKYETKNI